MHELDKLVEDILAGRENPGWIIWFIFVLSFPLGLLLIWLAELLQ